MDYKLTSLRLTAYRRMNFEDTTIDDSVQDLHRVWADSAVAVQQCRAALSSAHSKQEKAELQLTLLVCQQVGIRDFALLDQTIDQVYDLLPHVSDPRLRLHLLVHLFSETEDETLLPEIEAIIKNFAPKDEEDRYILQIFNDVQATLIKE